MRGSGGEGRSRARAVRAIVVVALLAVPVVAVSAPRSHADDPVGIPISGDTADCTDFELQFLPYIDFDITDEGWVLTRRSDGSRPRYVSASGVVEKSHVASNDTPANHNSHDHNTEIVVDPGQAGILSNVNGPNTTGNDDLDANDGADDITMPTTIEAEWEIGTFPSERGKTVAQRYFPRWAWPSKGDRVWTNGNWAFDCGHAKKLGHFVTVAGTRVFVGVDYYRSEIHPPRAIASMRSEAGTLPGTGTTRVPVTATDLFIHGEAGYVTDILNCGMSIIISGVDEDGDGSGDGDPDACPTKVTPIAENYQFDVCLPPKPSPSAELSWRIDAGPANSVASPQAQVHEIHEAGDLAKCANDGDPSTNLYDLSTALRVDVPLHGSGVAPVEVYARKIAAGWIDPPSTPLTHLRLTLDDVNVHSSGDGGVIASDDGELDVLLRERQPRRGRVDPARGLRARRLERQQRDERLRPEPVRRLEAVARSRVRLLRPERPRRRDRRVRVRPGLLRRELR